MLPRRCRAILTQGFRLIKERRFSVGQIGNAVSQAVLPNREMKVANGLRHDIITKAPKLPQLIDFAAFTRVPFFEKACEKRAAQAMFYCNLEHSDQFTVTR
jgi:hypothetical protein